MRQKDEGGEMTKKVALVVIDVQQAFMDPDPMLTIDGDDLLDKIEGLLKKARGAGTPVLYVEHVGFGKDRPPEHLHATHPRIAPQAGEPVIRKLFGDVFVDTPFEKELKRRGIEHLVVCGFATNGCVNAAAIHARALGYDVTVVEDAHATSDGWPVEKKARDVIPLFNAEWRRVGVHLMKARAVDFARL
jgi:nicotinamidase-related amidase